MKSLKNTTAALAGLMDVVWDAVFPEYAEPALESPVDRVRELLSPLAGEEAAGQFANRISEIKQQLEKDVTAIEANDPAARGRQEIIFCYPAVRAILHYRAAHQLWLLGVPILPRMLTEQAHSETGIDIHPGATIGESFAIDHGTGIVIGETAVIGSHVTIYQGVTLGARNFVYDDTGRPRNIPRHPVIEDNVTIYSNASLLGRITVGEGSVIGGNVWLTHSVPPHSRIIQSPYRESYFRDGEGI